MTRTANVAALRWSAAAATRVIRERAADSNKVTVTDHAQQRMEERGITLDDVLGILRQGHVYLTPRKNERSEWQAEMERRMPGGRDAAVVTVVPRRSGLIVRTVMWRDER